MGATKQFEYSAVNEPLYDPEILKKLDFSKFPAKFNPPISAAQPGDSLLVRPLCPDDYDKGFLQLLGQLTKVGFISRDQFLKRFETMKACRNTYFVTVIEDTLLHKIVGAATLVVEQKIIRDCGLRGHVEDVVVNTTYRGKQLGKLIVATVSLLAEELNCYKVSLECKDKLIPFYKSMGYTLEPENSPNSLTIRFDAS